MKTVITLILLAITLSAQLKPQDLKYMTEDYPPNNFVNEYGILTGASVEIVKAIWKDMGIEEQKIHLYPWARAYQQVLTNPGQVLFTMSRSEARIPLFKWVGPLSSSKHLIVAYKSDETVIKIDSLSQLSQYSVAAVRADVGEQILISKGVPESIFHVSPIMKDAIRTLVEGKVDLLSIGYEAMSTIQRQSGENSKFYVVHTIDVSHDYIAFSKDIPDSLVAQFQQSLHSISEEHQKILDKYNLRVIQE